MIRNLISIVFLLMVVCFNSQSFASSCVDFSGDYYSQSNPGITDVLVQTGCENITMTETLTDGKVLFGSYKTDHIMRKGKGDYYCQYWFEGIYLRMQCLDILPKNEVEVEDSFLFINNDGNIDSHSDIYNGSGELIDVWTNILIRKPKPSDPALNN